MKFIKHMVIMNIVSISVIIVGAVISYSSLPSSSYLSKYATEKSGSNICNKNQAIIDKVEIISEYKEVVEEKGIEEANRILPEAVKIIEDKAEVQLPAVTAMPTTIAPSKEPTVAATVTPEPTIEVTVTQAPSPILASTPTPEPSVSPTEEIRPTVVPTIIKTEVELEIEKELENKTLEIIGMALKESKDSLDKDCSKYEEFNEEIEESSLEVE